MSDDEQYLRDLERAAGAVGGIPDAYGQLRSLLDSLPPGTAPSVKQAGTGAPDVAAGAGGIGGNLTLQSNVPIGSESGAGIGRVAELFYGQSNILNDPTLEENGGNGAALGTTKTTITPSWSGHYVLNSGTAPGAITVFESIERAGPPLAMDTPMDSSQWILQLGGTVNTYDIDAYIYPTTDATFSSSGTDYGGAAYMIAAARINIAMSGGTLARFPTQNAYLEIYDAHVPGLAATSLPLDVSQIGYQQRLAAVLNLVDWGWSSAFEWRWRLRFHVVKASVLAFDLNLKYGEPTLHLASTATPNPFAPIIGRWQPSKLRVSRDDDTNYRLEIGSDTTTPALQWGSGAAAADTDLYRGAADLLKTDDTLYAVGNALAASYIGATTGVTIVAAGTWYKHTGLTATISFVPKYTGQRWLIACSGSWTYPTANTNVLVAVRLDSDTSGTLANWVLIQQQNSNAANTQNSFGGARIYTAGSGDVGNTRYAYFYAQAGVAASTVLTFYGAASSTYVSGIDVMALP